MHLAELLKDSAYRLTQFKSTHITALEARITKKDTGKSVGFYADCLVRNKLVKLTPEEVVRQLYVLVLKDDLGYPVDRMELEYGVTFGREKKRADICVFDKDRPTTPYILVELKKPKLKDGKEQLKSYCNATGAPNPTDLDEFVLDEHEHLVVKHDLFSHELKSGARTPDGIAEAFIEFAKKEKLGFFL